MANEKLFDRQTIFKIIIGSILGGLAIYLAFRGVSFSQLRGVLSRANFLLVVAGVFIVLINVGTLALRWWVMLLRKWDSFEYGFLLSGIYLGQMFNILVPARLGELARVYFVGEKLEETTKSRLFGSVMLEKVIDVISFGGALLILIAAMALPAWITEPGRTLLWLSGIALIGVIVLALWGRQLLAWITPLVKKLPTKYSERLAGILERALSGFDSMRDWKRLFPIWFLSFISLCLSALTNYLILQSLHILVPFSAALFVLIVLQVGSAPPSAPGKLGVFHYLTVLALSAYQVERGTALAYSVLLYVTALVPKILVGAGVFVLSKWSFDFRLTIEN